MAFSKNGWPNFSFDKIVVIGLLIIFSIPSATSNWNYYQLLLSLTLAPLTRDLHGKAIYAPTLSRSFHKYSAYVSQFTCDQMSLPIHWDHSNTYDLNIDGCCMLCRSCSPLHHSISSSFLCQVRIFLFLCFPCLVLFIDFTNFVIVICSCWFCSFSLQINTI